MTNVGTYAIDLKHGYYKKYENLFLSFYYMHLFFLLLTVPVLLILTPLLPGGFSLNQAVTRVLATA